MTEHNKPMPPWRDDAVDADPARVITRALIEARRRGLDDVSQTRFAVALVLRLRPDLSSSEAARSVEGVRRQAALQPTARPN